MRDFSVLANRIHLPRVQIADLLRQGRQIALQAIGNEVFQIARCAVLNVDRLARSHNLHQLDKRKSYVHACLLSMRAGGNRRQRLSLLAATKRKFYAGLI
jgi:hypothetical protein